jgi:RNA polymerase sigma-70 factor (ECF subfamily)
MAGPTEQGGGGRFPSTRWTLVRSARNPAERRGALDELFGTYWRPVYFYVRRKGHGPAAAEDVVQGVFTELVERGFEDKLDQSKGHFRGYLKRAVDHHLHNLHERETAQKRGGGAARLSFDCDAAELQLAAVSAPPEEAFDREWALTVVERALEELGQEFASGARRGPYDLFLKMFRTGAPLSYAQAAAEAGTSVSQLKAFLHRTRVRFRDLVRQRVADTVDGDASVDDEVRTVLELLAG